MQNLTVNHTLINPPKILNTKYIIIFNHHNKTIYSKHFLLCYRCKLQYQSGNSIAYQKAANSAHRHQHAATGQHTQDRSQARTGAGEGAARPWIQYYYAG